MCEVVNDLKVLAETVITKEHEVLSQMFTEEDKINFVNSVRTLQEHSNYLIKEMTEI